MKNEATLQMLTYKKNKIQSVEEPVIKKCKDENPELQKKIAELAAPGYCRPLRVEADVLLRCSYDAKTYKRELYWLGGCINYEFGKNLSIEIYKIGATKFIREIKDLDSSKVISRHEFSDDSKTEPLNESFKIYRYYFVRKEMRDGKEQDILKVLFTDLKIKNNRFKNIWREITGGVSKW